MARAFATWAGISMRYFGIPYFSALFIFAPENGWLFLIGVIGYWVLTKAISDQRLW